VLDLDAGRPTTEPRDAATVVVVRDREGAEPGNRGGAEPQLEVFCVKRHKKSGFLGGAVVFPGGKLDPADYDEVWVSRTTEGAARTTEFAVDAPTARALGVAAARESLEEAGIVPTSPGVDARAAEAMRAELAGAEAPLPPGGPFAAALEARSLRLALSALVPLSHWVTPAAEQRRFDARFFLMALPPGQVVRHDEHETTQSFWARPSHILQQFAAAEIMLAPPTLRLLELLASVADVAEAMQFASRQCLDPICPEFHMVGEVPTLTLPGDPLHSVDASRIGGKTRFILEDGKFVSADP